jgi:TRAP-type C4-dicarboxylate transport system permease small subunit
MTGRLDRLLDLLCRAYLRASQALLLALVLAVGVQVLLRYATSKSILGLEELTALAFVWLCFLMAAVLHRRQRHICVTAVSDLLPAWARPWCEMAIAAATLAFCAVVFVQLANVWPFLLHTSVIFRIPEPASKLALAVGIGTILLQEIVNLASIVRQLRRR